MKTIVVRNLRTNMTDAEKMLWSQLRLKQMGGHRFRRQHPMGNRYVADFICLEKKLVVELDGGHHAEQTEEDTLRDKWFEKEGYRVLRFWNNVVFKEMEAVKQTIWNALEG